MYHFKLATSQIYIVEQYEYLDIVQDSALHFTVQCVSNLDLINAFILKPLQTYLTVKFGPLWTTVLGLVGLQF